MRVLVTAIVQTVLLSQWAHASSLEVCIKHYIGNEQDFYDLVDNGPIEIPAGTVFQSAGHKYGTPSDPRDEEHMQSGNGQTWSGIPHEEQIRRAKIFQGESSMRTPPTAILLTENLVLSKTHYCGIGRASSVLSSKWGWQAAPSNTSDMYYEAYGIYKGGSLNTSFDNMGNLGLAAQSGQLVAIVHGKITNTIHLP